MEPDQEKAEIKRQNEELKRQLQEYKSLEEDLAAKRIFEKAKTRLAAYFTFGGIVLILSGLVGIQALTDYAKGLAKDKMDAIAKDQINKALQEEAERQITMFVKEKRTDFLVMARQQIDRVILATQPIGQSRRPESTVASITMLDYTNRMSAVKDVGTEGSIVGFAAAAALEYQIQQTLGRQVTISPRYIYYHARLKGQSPTDKDVGATLRDAVAILTASGAVLEESWPYRAGEFAATPPKDVERAEHFKVAHAHPVRNVAELKAALQKFGPVIGGLSLYKSFLSATHTKGHVPMPQPNEALYGSIAVCFVGFNDSEKWLKFQNAWGTKWGDNGYGYISYEYAEKFLSDAWAISMR